MNESVVLSPSVFKVLIARAARINSSAPLTHRVFGFRTTAGAKRPHMPCVAMSVWWSLRGLRGQKIQRPQTTSRAGRTVSMTMTVHAIPMAQTGPRLAVDLRSAKLRQIRPRMTVIAEAPIGGAAPRQAAVIARTRLSYSCNSSRYLLISSSA